jgi:hypothetical protein
MLIDKQAPPSDGNIKRSDPAILMVFRGPLVTIISPFTSYLHKVLQAVGETPLGEEILSFARRNPTS